jgi:hypothetical protein
VARFCFGASCLLGLTGSICSGSAVITCFIGIPIGGLVGCFGARAFTRLGKYFYYLGNAVNK